MRIGLGAALVMQRNWQRRVRQTHDRWRTLLPDGPCAYRLAGDVTCCPAANVGPTSTKGTDMTDQQPSSRPRAGFTAPKPAVPTGTITGARRPWNGSASTSCRSTKAISAPSTGPHRSVSFAA